MNDIQCWTEKRSHLNKRASWRVSAFENDLAKWARFSWMGLELRVGGNKACGMLRAGGVAEGRGGKWSEKIEKLVFNEQAVGSQGRFLSRAEMVLRVVVQEVFLKHFKAEFHVF